MDYGKILQAAIIGGVAALIAGSLQRWWRRRRGLPAEPVVPTQCPRCATPLPKIRRPTSLRQTLWGGWTCAGCGAELNNLGQEIPGPHN